MTSPFDPHTGRQAEPADTVEVSEAGGADGRRASQRRRILDAAMACFAREGFHGTSMQKICAEAGMSPGALYRYFRSKEELIAAIVADERSTRLHLLDAVAQAPSVLGALTDCLHALLVEPSLPSVQLGPEIMAEAIRNADLRAAIAPCEAESQVQMAQAVRAAMANGEIESALALDDVILLLQVMADGILLHHQLHPEWSLPQRLPAISALVRRMLAPRGEDPAAAGEG